MKYDKEFQKPDGRKLITGGPRDLQRKQKVEDRQHSELINFLREEVQRLNKELAGSGSGGYTGEQVDEEIRKAVSSAVAETKIVSEEKRKELQSAVDAFRINEKSLLEQIKNLEIYQAGVTDKTDTLRLEKDKVAAEKKEIKDELDTMRARRDSARAETDMIKIEVNKLNTKLGEVEKKYFSLEQELIDVENQRVALANELLEAKTSRDPEFAEEMARKEAEFKENLKKVDEEKNNLNALHNKDMGKFQSEIEFLNKERNDLTNKHDKEITKFRIEDEKKKGDIKSLKERAKQKGVDGEVTDLLKEQTKQIEALTEALANAETQLEIETNRPKMETAFIDPLEKGAGEDLTPHIEIKVEKPAEEKGEMDAKIKRLRSLMGKLPSVNG